MLFKQKLHAHPSNSRRLVTTDNCQRNITGHLEMLKLRGDDVLSEKELILLRAGKDIFVALSSQSFPVGCNLFIASFLHIRSI